MFLAVAGCRGKESPKEAASSETVTDAGGLDQSLKLWKEGKQEEAAQAFLAVDWKKVTHFTEGSDLNLSEDEIKALPEPQRSQQIQRTLAVLSPLKALNKHVIALGAGSLANKDFPAAQRYLEAASNFGALMSQARHMVIVQLTGKAIQQGALQELVTLYRQTEKGEALKAAEERLRQVSRKQ